LMKLTVGQLTDKAKRMHVSGVPKLKWQLVDKILQEQQLKQEAASRQPRSETGVPAIQQNSEGTGMNQAGQKEQPIAVQQREPESSQSPPEPSGRLLTRTPTVAYPNRTASSPRRNAAGGGGRVGQHDPSQPQTPLHQSTPRVAFGGSASSSPPRRISTATPTEKSAAESSRPSRSGEETFQHPIIPHILELKPKTQNYDSVVVDLSGRRESKENHITAQELVCKLTDFMMKTGKMAKDERSWNLSQPQLIFNITGTAESKDDPERPNTYIQLCGEEATEELEGGEESEAGGEESDNAEAPADVQAAFSPPAPPDKDLGIGLFKKDWPQRWFYKRLKDYITQVVFGIADRKKSCWIMDGGTNAGIMRLMGKMHRDHFNKHNKVLHSPKDFPMIGFSDLCILDKERFPQFSRFSNENDGFPNFKHMQDDFTDDKPSNKRYEPDPDHTHHVCVHSKGLKCGSLRTQPHEHHFLLRQYLHLAKTFPECPIVRRTILQSHLRHVFV
jgi:hypothetical protein